MKHSILESNISQTVGSASSSVASGVLFTIPALFIWGMSPAWSQITLLAMAGGLLGVLSMVPLRRYLIEREHGKLPYPEGMACAEVLVAAEGGGRQAHGVFWGIGVGMFFQLLTQGLQIVRSSFEIALPFKASLAARVNAPLLGVGYILGIRIATVMVAGGALSSLVLIPAINIWGQSFSQPVYPETELLIRDMSSGQIWNRYIRYIGAGAVATGGIITLIKSIPTMVESFKLGLAQMQKRIGDGAENIERTEWDLSMRTVGVFAGIILLVLTVVPGILGYIDSMIVRGIASICIAIFAFFFVTVSSRIVGLVGVTSNPTSGMTIATLLGTSTIFYLMGWTDLYGKATALMVGTAVCIAASIAGDTSQDLKTGFILGATPRRQQIGELIGVVTSPASWRSSSSSSQGHTGRPGRPRAAGTPGRADEARDRRRARSEPAVGVHLHRRRHRHRSLALQDPRAGVRGRGVPAALDDGPSSWAGCCGGSSRREQPEAVAEHRREQGVLFGSGPGGRGRPDRRRAGRLRSSPGRRADRRHCPRDLQRRRSRPRRTHDRGRARLPRLVRDAQRTGRRELASGHSPSGCACERSTRAGTTATA